MSKNNLAEATVSDIVRTEEIPVTAGTLAWIEDLYRAGAVEVSEREGVSVEPRVRELIAAMHTVLAGGEVNVEIVQRGGVRFAQLEEAFELACDEADTARRVRPADALIPYTP